MALQKTIKIDVFVVKHERTGRYLTDTGRFAADIGLARVFATKDFAQAMQTKYDPQKETIITTLAEANMVKPKREKPQTVPKIAVPRQNANNRMFRGMPVRDGIASIRVQPSAEDIAAAKPGDPAHCAYAECLRRQWHAANVWIFKSVAYIQLLDDNGKPVIERYKVRDKARWFLEEFDAGKPVHPAGFMLTPPKKAETLDFIRDKRRKESAKRKAEGVKVKTPKKATIHGEATSNRTGAAIEPTEMNAFTRSGNGMVHFTAEGKKSRKPDSINTRLTYMN